MPSNISVRPHTDQMGVETHVLLQCKPCDGTGYVMYPMLRPPCRHPQVTKNAVVIFYAIWDRARKRINPWDMEETKQVFIELAEQWRAGFCKACPQLLESVTPL